MKTSEALRLTKAKVWDGRGDAPPDNRGRFCCLSADCAGAGVAGIVRPIMEKLLGKYRTLGMWLSSQQGIDTFGNTTKLQATRHAWLDHLIAHYESIGD